LARPSGKNAACLQCSANDFGHATVWSDDSRGWLRFCTTWKNLAIFSLPLSVFKWLDAFEFGALKVRKVSRFLR